MTRGEEVVVGWMEYELETIKPLLESAEAIFGQYEVAKWTEYNAKRDEAILDQHQKAEWKAKWREDEMESAEAILDQYQISIFGQHKKAKWRAYELESAEALFDQQQKKNWRKYEFESADPMSKRHEEQDEQYKKESAGERSQFLKNISNLKDMIGKAEVLGETLFKREIQMKAAKYTNPINSFETGIMSTKLHKIRDEITRVRRAINFPKFAKFAQLPPSSSPASPESHRVPHYLRHYINYFVLFPRDFKVPARRLIALWVAEGLVQSDDQSAEKIADRYLDELIHLREIDVERNRNGKVKTCWIDDGRRDDLLKKAEEASFLHGKDGNVLRLVDHNGCDANGGTSFIKIDEKPIDSDKMREVISFLSFNTKEGSKPGEDIGEFLRRCISTGCFTWLKVLDLEGVFRPNLPDTLDKLIALKYLGLRWTYLEQLPDSVDKLFNLQVLDMKHTYISVLPRSIWCMEFLRHLYLSEIYRTRFPDPPSKVTLTALQTLWGAFIDKNTRVKEGLDTLQNIRKLGLSCRSKSRTTESETSEMKGQWEAIDKWISKLKYLETLRLKSRDENNQASDLPLTSLEGNQNLSTVYLLGKLKRSILCELPVSLTDITLSGSKLDVDPMKFLGRLPNLLILRLLAHSVVKNDELYCSGRRFKKLKVLWIWHLEIKDFEADEESLPCLEELEIRSCKNLEKLPDRLRQLENLEIRLTSMPKEFVHREKKKYADVEYVLEEKKKNADVAYVPEGKKKNADVEYVPEEKKKYADVAYVPEEKKKHAADDILGDDDQGQWILKNTQKAKGKQVSAS